MAMIHRTLFTWFLLLVFLILLGLRLDTRTHWNWFVVLVPVWLYDVMLLLHIALHTVSDCRAASTNCQATRERLMVVSHRLYQFLLALLKIAFLVMLCVNLNSGNGVVPISWYAVFAPLVTVMVCLCVNTFAMLTSYSD